MCLDVLLEPDYFELDFAALGDFRLLGGLGQQPVVESDGFDFLKSEPVAEAGSAAGVSDREQAEVEAEDAGVVVPVQAVAK